MGLYGVVSRDWGIATNGENFWTQCLTFWFVSYLVNWLVFWLLICTKLSNGLVKPKNVREQLVSLLFNKGLSWVWAEVHLTETQLHVTYTKSFVTGQMRYTGKPAPNKATFSESWSTSGGEQWEFCTSCWWQIPENFSTYFAKIIMKILSGASD
jgi:hypothetical protein